MTKAFRIKNHPDYYITDTGDVYSRKIYRNNPNCRIKKQTPEKDKYGYLMIELWKDNKPYIKKIHRLVAEAFIPNPENKPQVNHKNGIKTDNRVENLEWATASENAKHAYKVLGRVNSKGMLGKTGILNKKSKTVLQIKDDKIIAKFYGIQEAARQTGLYASNITKCCKNNLAHTGGYKWCYEQKGVM